MDKKRTGLVLSGGGAKGAFQVGALKELRRQGFGFSVVAGVSVGALNGAMIATNQIMRLERVWDNIEQKDVYKKNSLFKLARQYAIYKLGFGKAPRSLYDNSPLYDLIKENLEGKKLMKPFFAGRVQLESGEYDSRMGEFLMQDPNKRSERFIQKVFASTCIPVIWEPINILGKNYVDGGVRNISPTSDLIDYNIDRMIIINTQPMYETPSNENADIFGIAQRSFDIMLNEIFQEDVNRFLDINRFVKQAEGQGAILHNSRGKRLRYVPTMLIEPHKGLGSALDFEHERIQSRKKLGIQMAKEAIENFNRIP